MEEIFNTDQMDKVNINQMVVATLTKSGAEAINKYNAQCLKECTEVIPQADVEDLKKIFKCNYVEGETVRDSLWHLFSQLGDYFDYNTSAPFKNNEFFIE